MADAFPISGNIDSTSFPYLLVDLHRRGATGSLKVNGPVHPKALYFRGGRILFGSSNDPHDQLGAILIESGKITREQLDEVNGKVGPGNPLAKLLAESGFVNQRELGDAARVKVERILSDVISWSQGSFEFEDGVLPKGAVDLKLSTERLLLAAVQRIHDRDFALRHLGGDTAVVLEAAPGGETTLGEVRAEIWPLLERLDGERTLQDAVALTRLDEFDAAKMACAMLFLGIVRRKEAASEDELDLAEQALSALGEHAAEDDAPEDAPSASPAPGLATIPPPAPFPALDEEPSAEPALSTSSPEADVPLVEPPPEIPTTFTLPETPEPEPSGLSDEPGGFAFITETEPGSQAEEGLQSSPVQPSEPPPPVFSEHPTESPEPAPPQPAEVAATSFSVEPPVRAGTDTLPGDRPAYTPPDAEPDGPASEAPESEPEISLPPSEPEPPAPPDAPARPTQEDLAALDALLNPSATSKVSPMPQRPRPEAWEPRFRPGASATMGPSASARRAASRRPRPSRAPLLAGLAGLVIVGVAGGYYWIGRSSEPAATPTPQPTIEPTPALSAPATVVAAPPPTVTPTGTTTPTADASASPTAPPVPAPVATPSPVAPPPVSAGDALALLRRGAFDESARASAAALATGPSSRFSIQVLAACSPETIRKAAQNVSGSQIFILPVVLNGRPCFRVCWGVYDTREGARAGVGTLPDYFRESGISPRISPLAELLP